jgi:hypothetical protein
VLIHSEPAFLPFVLATIAVAVAQSHRSTRAHANVLLRVDPLSLAQTRHDEKRFKYSEMPAAVGPARKDPAMAA